MVQQAHGKEMARNGINNMFSDKGSRRIITVSTYFKKTNNENILNKHTLGYVVGVSKLTVLLYCAGLRY